ncbi:MAG: DcaP family trimeric outer membrane transporter [Bacteroidota bacterium]
MLRKMKPRLTTLLLLLFAATSYAQDFDVSFHGYIGLDASYDSRSSVIARNRHIYLYPLPEKRNDSGDDLNNQSQFDIDGAHSRFGLDISGPDIGNFSSSAMIEGDFLGLGDPDSYFRLRHAFISLSNKKWTFLGGQTWHPIFVTGNFPGTVNANAGTPFHPLLRSPQIRITREISSSTRLSFFIVDQNNFRNTGYGSNSTEEALFPELDARLNWETRGILVALTGGMKTLAVPENIAGSPASPEKVRSSHFSASFRYTLPGFIFRMEGLYGGNLSEMAMLGGTGRTLADDDYVPLSTGSIWTDIQTNNQNGWQPGIFAGYTANMGAREEVAVVEDLSRSKGQVASVYAVSPRLKYVFDSFWIGAEWLFTNAAWSEETDDYGVPVNTENYKNHRLLLSLRYNF